MRTPTVNVPGAAQVKVAPDVERFDSVPPVVAQRADSGSGPLSSSRATTAISIEPPTPTSAGIADMLSITGQRLNVAVTAATPWQVSGICSVVVIAGVTLNVSSP